MEIIEGDRGVLLSCAIETNRVLWDQAQAKLTKHSLEGIDRSFPIVFGHGKGKVVFSRIKTRPARLHLNQLLPSQRFLQIPTPADRDTHPSPLNRLPLPAAQDVPDEQTRAISWTPITHINASKAFESSAQIRDPIHRHSRSSSPLLDELSKEDHKFVYGHLIQGLRARCAAYVSGTPKPAAASRAQLVAATVAEVDAVLTKAVAAPRA